MNIHQDTIVALATAPGIGAIGIIRISGTAAFPIVNTLFPSKDLNIQKTHTIHYGHLLKKITCQSGAPFGDKIYLITIIPTMSAILVSVLILG